jgi:hypothetical protein
VAVVSLDLLARVRAPVRDAQQLDWSLVDPGFEIHDHELVDSPVHHGREGWSRWLSDFRQAFHDFRAEDIDRLQLDEQRILTVHRLWARGSASGIEFERTDAQLWTFRGDLLVRLDYYPDYRAGEESWAPPGATPRVAAPRSRPPQ